MANGRLSRRSSHGFDPRRVQAMLTKPLKPARAMHADPPRGKLKSVRDNAAAMLDVAAELGKLWAFWLGDWPGDNVVGFVGGAWASASINGRQFRLDFPADGRQGHVRLTNSVVARPEALGRDRCAAEEPQGSRCGASRLNSWAAESGLPLCHLKPESSPFRSRLKRIPQ